MYIRMMRAYESLGKILLRVLPNRCTLVWARTLLAMEDTCLPRTVMFSRTAKGRILQGRPIFQMVILISTGWSVSLQDLVGEYSECTS